LGNQSSLLPSHHYGKSLLNAVFKKKITQLVRGEWKLKLFSETNL
jgi:hypothetical protein